MVSLFGAASRRAVQVTVPFAALAVLASRTQDAWVSRVDQRTIDGLRRERHPTAVAAAKVVSAMAEPKFVSMVLAVHAVSAARRSGWRDACAPVLVIASGAMVRRTVSRVVARPRPPAAVWLMEPEGFSLPSKHTTLAVLTVGALVNAASTTGPRRRASRLVAAAGVGASRVYLGVHWPSDVLAAWLFAEGWLSLTRQTAPAWDRPAARTGAVTR